MPDGTIVRADRDWSFDDTQYPAGGAWSPADFGGVALADPPNVDPRAFVVVETEPGIYETSARPLAAVKADRIAAAAALRWQTQTAGIGGFRTDPESQSLLTGATLQAMLDPAYTVDWKTSAGWVQLSAAQIIAAAQAVRAHVQACFDAERAHAQAIEALATAESVLAYDIDSGWPG